MNDPELANATNMSTLIIDELVSATSFQWVDHVRKMKAIVGSITPIAAALTLPGGGSGSVADLQVVGVVAFVPCATFDLREVASGAANVVEPLTIGQGDFSKIFGLFFLLSFFAAFHWGAYFTRKKFFAQQFQTVGRLRSKRLLLEAATYFGPKIRSKFRQSNESSTGVSGDSDSHDYTAQGLVEHHSELLVSLMLHEKAASEMRYPALTIAAANLSLQGIAFEAFALMQNWEGVELTYSVALALFGLVILVVFCFGFLAVLLYFKTKTWPSSQHYPSYLPLTLQQGPIRLLKLLVPSRYWQPGLLNGQFGGVFQSLKLNRQWFLFAGPTRTIIIAFIASFRSRSKTGCDVQFLLLAHVGLLYAGLLIGLRPYRFATQTISSVVLSVLASVVFVCPVIEVFEPFSPLFLAISVLAAFGFAVVQLLLEIFEGVKVKQEEKKFREKFHVKSDHHHCDLSEEPNQAQEHPKPAEDDDFIMEPCFDFDDKASPNEGEPILVAPLIPNRKRTKDHRGGTASADRTLIPESVHTSDMSSDENDEDATEGNQRENDFVSMTEVAAAVGSTVEELLALNPSISNAMQRLPPNQKLKLP